jgi:hypothetical protein
MRAAAPEVRGPTAAGLPLLSAVLSAGPVPPLLVLLLLRGRLSPCRMASWSGLLPCCSASGRLLRVADRGCVGMRLFALTCISWCCWPDCACCCCWGWPLGCFVGDLYAGMREGTVLPCRAGPVYAQTGVAVGSAGRQQIHYTSTETCWWLVLRGRLTH